MSDTTNRQILAALLDELGQAFGRGDGHAAVAVMTRIQAVFGRDFVDWLMTELCRIALTHHTGTAATQ
jgi:hypothetical protein